MARTLIAISMLTMLPFATPLRGEDADSEMWASFGRSSLHCQGTFAGELYQLHRIRLMTDVKRDVAGNPVNPWDRVLYEAARAAGLDRPMERHLSDAADKLAKRYGLDELQREQAYSLLEDGVARLAAARQARLANEAPPWWMAFKPSRELEADEYDSLVRNSDQAVSENLAELALSTNRFAEIAGQSAAGNLAEEFEELSGELWQSQSYIHKGLEDASTYFMDQRRLRWADDGCVETEWGSSVEAFCRHYGFDADQRARAAEILRVAARDAAECRRGSGQEYSAFLAEGRRLAEAEAEMFRRQELALAEKDDLAQGAAILALQPLIEEVGEFRRRVKSQAARLAVPLERICGDLREALDALPTDAQRRRAGTFRGGLPAAVVKAGGSVAGRRLRWTGAGVLEREWEAYVEGFRRHYRLEGEREERAAGMLAAAQRDAAEYRRGRETEYAALVRELQELQDAESAKAAAPGRRRRIEAQAARLTAPLERIFANLRQALDTLPTDGERRQAGRFRPAGEAADGNLR